MLKIKIITTKKGTECPVMAFEKLPIGVLLMYSLLSMYPLCQGYLGLACGKSIF